MDEVLKALIELVVMWIIVFVTYLLLYRKKKDFSTLKEKDEVRNFVLKYDISVNRINYPLMLRVLALINSFIISIGTIIVFRIDNIWMKILVCFVVVFSLVYALYTIAGKYFKTHELNVFADQVVKTKKTKKSKKKEEKK